MVDEYLQIAYDPFKKIWTSSHYPYSNLIQGSLGEKFLKTMRSINPNKIIDYFYDSNTEKSAKEVYEQSIIVAKNLQRLGIKKDDVVSFFCTNNEHVAVLTMGCILIGALVNYFEVYMSDEHIDKVFEIVRPAVILYEEKHKSKYIQHKERTTLQSLKYEISIDGEGQCNVKKELLKYDDVIDFDKFESVKVEDPQNELAYLMLTSGSTGAPKVVQISHSLIMHGAYIWWDNKTKYEPLTSESVIFSFSPLRWISQGMTVLESLLVGAKRVSCCGAHEGKYGLELLRKCKLTHVFVAPSIFYNILMQLDAHDVDSLKSLKMVLLGGEQPSQVLLKLAKKHCVNAKLYYCYGMTEMGSCISNDEDINGGKLLPGYRMQILDDHCKPLGPNQKGQIALKPAFPLKDYRSIDCHNYYNDKGFFINGDYGYIDDQRNLHVLSRYKDLIYSNNLTLIPNPLENIIAELPEISVARLTGCRKSAEDPNEVGVFFVILNNNNTTPHDEISKKIYKTLQLHLSAAEMAIIQDIFYIDCQPVTTCGKVDRVALKNLALEKSQLKS